MKIIISPAKNMNQEEDVLPTVGLPVFLEQAEQLCRWMQRRSYEEAKRLWRCGDQIAALNFKRFARMDLRHRLVPAILAYEGIQYQYMAPAVFERKMFGYVQEHLRILSGLYGVLKPMDGVTPYRLEMQAKVKINGAANLYAFWGDQLYKELLDEDRTIINLASKEYSKCVERYLSPEDRYVTCIFGELAGGRIVQKGVYVKMARGEMVRFLAEWNLQGPEGMKEFQELGYRFQPDRSTARRYVFLR